MPAAHRNPDVPNTAARHLVKVMTCVHPAQREELLTWVIAHAEACLRQIRTGTAEERKAA